MSIVHDVFAITRTAVRVLWLKAKRRLGLRYTP